MHKRCVMRSGQPKCVCAPKCKSAHRGKSVSGIKRHHRRESIDAHKIRRNAKKENIDEESFSTSPKVTSHRKTQRESNKWTQLQRIHGHDRTENVQIILDSKVNGNASIPKSDKIISIVAPTSLNKQFNSHRYRKSRTNSMEASSSSHGNHNRHHAMANGRSYGPTTTSNGTMHWHGHRHRYNNHRRHSAFPRTLTNVSREDRIRSNFYEHDLSVSSIDLMVRNKWHVNQNEQTLHKMRINFK